MKCVKAEARQGLGGHSHSPVLPNAALFPYPSLLGAIKNKQLKTARRMPARSKARQHRSNYYYFSQIAISASHSFPWRIFPSVFFLIFFLIFPPASNFGSPPRSAALRLERLRVFAAVSAATWWPKHGTATTVLGPAGSTTHAPKTRK